MSNVEANITLSCDSVSEVATGSIATPPSMSSGANVHGYSAKSEGASVADAEYLASSGKSSNAGYEIVKRFGDLILVLIALPILLPIFLIIAVVIYAEDRGKILYFQYRTGKNGKPFKFYKFRSMVPNADKLKQELAAQNEATGPIFKMKNDPRVTRIGRVLRRYSLDELPQLINVLRGEMSIVGPRPLLEADQCTPRQFHRHSVLPGLLCIREVKGRSDLSFEEWMELDLQYVKTRGFWTDVWILAQAVPAVLGADGAY